MTDYATGVAGAREDLCRFLSACYYEPTTDFTAEHLFESMQTAAAAIDAELADGARRLGAAFVAEELQSLLVDHTRLFIGPSQPAAMPYASFWSTRDTSERHEATMAVVDFYTQGGFDVSDDLHELPDHVAIELEFLYALIFAQNHPAADDDRDDRASTRTLYRRFVAEHLSCWFGDFAAAVKTAAETAFYRELVAVTARFIQLEQALL